MRAGHQTVGTHTELIRRDPLYAELAATQFLAPAVSADPTIPGRAADPATFRRRLS